MQSARERAEMKKKMDQMQDELRNADSGSCTIL